jgi:hypothetical protein
MAGPFELTSRCPYERVAIAMARAAALRAPSSWRAVLGVVGYAVGKLYGGRG